MHIASSPIESWSFNPHAGGEMYRIAHWTENIGSAFNPHAGGEMYTRRTPASSRSTSFNPHAGGEMYHVLAMVIDPRSTFNPHAGGEMYSQSCYYLILSSFFLHFREPPPCFYFFAFCFVRQIVSSYLSTTFISANPL